MFDYAKKEYNVVEASDFHKISDEYEAVILIFENIDNLKNIDSLMEYTFYGGNLFFGFRLAPSETFNNIYRKLGINEYSDFQNASGIKLLENVLIKGKGLEISDEIFMTNSSLRLTLSEDTKKLAESTDGVQLLWKKNYGQGNIMYFNGTMLGDKVNRGFLIGALSILIEDFIYPIINSKVTYIDDFPAPIPDGRNSKIESEFNRNISSFYKEIWWPNMLELSAKYKIKYTGMIIGTYNDEVDKVSKELIDINKKEFVYYGKEIIRQGGEIGIHGYNHQPLNTDSLFNDFGYEPWKDIKTMSNSIEIVNNLSKSIFPSYKLNVYVPPSNILSSKGREALINANSDVRIISSLYTAFGDKDVYEQEFELSPDGIIEFPRITYGYNYTNEIVWQALNGITSHGILSHFVHPDDVLDNHRAGVKGWTELIEEYDKFNKIIFDDFSWLRGMTASEGANELIKYLYSSPKYSKNDNSLKTYNDNYVDKIYYILRSSKEINSSENSKVKKIDNDIYLIESVNPIFQIEYKR